MTKSKSSSDSEEEDQSRLVEKEEDEDDAAVQSDDADEEHPNNHSDDDKSQEEEKSKKKKKRKIHKLSLTETENFNEKLKKRGVVYIARIPPKMTPTKIKALLSEIAGTDCEVTRVYLVQEDASKRKRRKKEYGRSGGKRYVEGWVEVSNKKIAKKMAMQLNNTPISMHKRNPHYGDLWNLKYLPKFKWSHLTEKVAYERRVREQKLRVEMMHARRENAAYVQMVETGKKLDQIEARRNNNNNDTGKRKHDGGGDDDNKIKAKNRRHKHHQTKPLNDGSDKSAKKALLGGLV